jgi:predicted TIM-barrel fold metal-dependent hydrolase
LWEVAAQENLVVGILLEPQQMAQAETVIRTFPTVTVIIDHMGRFQAPAPSDPLFQRLIDLRDCDNVYVKMSGFYAFSQRPYPYEDLQPQAQALYQAYGASRLMWASDYPLLLHAGESYPQDTAILDQQLKNLSSGEHDQIMSKTAAAVFGL